MECLGFEPGAAGWKAQTKPRSYGDSWTFLDRYLMNSNASDSRGKSTR